MTTAAGNPKVRNSNVLCDLGQLTHVFSDKTGTLTQNTMRVAKVCLPGGVDLGEFRPISENNQSGGDIYPAGLQRAGEVLWKTPPGKEGLRGSAETLFRTLALCNSLQVRIGQ